jgi:hypothetical protein
MLSNQDAKAIYHELQRISWELLKAIGCDREPHRPIVRTRRWKHGKPRGMLYHYTNGPSGLKSMRWGNHPGWGNTKCSWQVTVFDRITDNVIGELWVKLVDAELRRLFPVPTIVMADFRWSTWHGNWTNDVLLGVENRNTGYSGWTRVDKRTGIEKLGKLPLITGDRKWEPYTREQMVSNINLGRLVHALFDLEPDYVLSHQCVWATKQDTGPGFPLHDVRRELFADTELADQQWLAGFEMAPDTNEDDDAWWEEMDYWPRCEVEFVPWAIPTKGIVEDLEFAAQALYAIGFNTGPELPDESVLRRAVKWFQRSTQAYKYHKAFDSKHVLSPDGVAGPLTVAGLKRRLRQLRLTDDT